MGSVAKGFVGLTGLLLGAVIIVFLIPRYLEEPEPIQRVTGTVGEVRLPNRSDILIVLKGDARTYLVKGGISSGRPFSEWGDDLVERSVTIQVMRFTWSSSRPEQQDVPVVAIYRDEELYFRVAG